MADEPTGIIDPTSVSFMAGAGTSLTFTDLDEDERTILDRDLKRLNATLKSRQFPELWAADRDSYLWGAAIAKKQLGDIPFRGLLALSSGQFGMQPIRSEYILSGTPHTWLVSQAATGWVTNAFNVNLATSTGTVTNTQNRVILCAPKLVNYAASPKVNMVRHTIGPTKYAVQVVDWYKLSDLWVSDNLGTIIISKNGTFTTDQQVESVGVDGTALFGLAFGTGDWMNLET